MPVTGSTKFKEWLTMLCCTTSVNCCTFLYVAHESLWTMVPLRRCHCIIGSSVSADRYHHSKSWRLTRVHHPKYPNLLCSRMASVILQIHMGIYRSNPALSSELYSLTLGLRRKRDSSIWTITPGLPSRRGASMLVKCQLHMSRRY